MDVWVGCGDAGQRPRRSTTSRRASRTSVSRTRNGAATPSSTSCARPTTLTSKWADDLVEHADGLDETDAPQGTLLRQAGFRCGPLHRTSCLTNPELFRETVASSRENLVRGMRMLAEDISAGKGDLKAPAVRCHELRGRTGTFATDARQGDRAQRGGGNHPVFRPRPRKC